MRGVKGVERVRGVAKGRGSGRKNGEGRGGVRQGDVRRGQRAGAEGGGFGRHVGGEATSLEGVPRHAVVYLEPDLDLAERTTQLR